MCKRLRTPEHYAIATRRLLETLAAQNVSYAEITLVGRCDALEEVTSFRRFSKPSQREAARSRVDVRWIIDIVRQFPIEDAWRVAELAAERVGDGVVAIGIGGDEARGPARKFAEVYRWARDRGLAPARARRRNHRPSERLGSARDRRRTDRSWHRRARRPGSARIFALAPDPARNLPHQQRSDRGRCLRIEKHPVRALYDAGRPADPQHRRSRAVPLHARGRVRSGAETFGFTEPELRGIARNGFRFAFDRSDLGVGEIDGPVRHSLTTLRIVRAAV